jgi:site-specific recombinase XerD
LRVRDMQSRQGVVHFRVRGKRDKIRFVPVHAMAQRLIEEYLAVAGHGADGNGADLWLRLQATYDAWEATRRLASELTAIPTLRED